LFIFYSYKKIKVNNKSDPITNPSYFIKLYKKKKIYT